ncbi:shikimate kinase [Jeotgalibacillus proteolyticus]|uniref:Shikimate kinase n=1 Tax=Jeotgalibacillus proteolyticus TaxID=2082395 RepID=A0A2S5GEH2_9BACL|nr:shikimate kinase [Jeotgalibacillus proteolyticus]PPA71396.1 shikimate kinase [Jeotgalibacillus proteolyticus]
MKENGHVFLIGFMGAGKSTIGRLLADRLRKDFIDVDALIVQKENKSISDIFSEHGEAFFREKEAAYLKKISGGSIIATGGGILYFSETLEWMKQNGTIVYLQAPFSILYERIFQDSNRPLAMTKSEASLKELYSKRHDVYSSAADLIVPTDCRVEESVDLIIERLQKD